MVGTTTPVVYGPHTWKVIIAIYAVAQIAGALVTGAAMWGIGIGLRTMLDLDLTVAAGITAVVAVLGALHDLKLAKIWLPTSNWQVPREWRRFPRPLMAAMFGFGIGMGIVTRIPFASFHVVLIATTLIADLQSALIVMFVYGATRALGVAVTSQLQLLIQDVQQRPTMINRFGPLVGYLNGLILAGIAGVVVGAMGFNSYF